jgi:hypothetical protein
MPKNSSQKIWLSLQKFGVYLAKIPGFTQHIPEFTHKIPDISPQKNHTNFLAFTPTQKYHIFELLLFLLFFLPQILSSRDAHFPPQPNLDINLRAPSPLQISVEASFSYLLAIYYALLFLFSHLPGTGRTFVT